MRVIGRIKTGIGVAKYQKVKKKHFLKILMPKQHNIILIYIPMKLRAY